MTVTTCEKCGGRAFQTTHGLVVCASGVGGTVGCGHSVSPAKATKPAAERGDRPWFRLPTLDELTAAEVRQLTPAERAALSTRGSK